MGGQGWQTLRDLIAVESQGLHIDQDQVGLKARNLPGHFGVAGDLLHAVASETKKLIGGIGKGRTVIDHEDLP